MIKNGDQTIRMPALSREVARRNSLARIECQHRHVQQVMMDLLPLGTEVLIEAFWKVAKVNLMNEVVTLSAALDVVKHFHDKRQISLEMIN